MGSVGIAMGAWSPDSDEERRSDIKAVKAAGFAWMRSGIGWAFTTKPDGTVNINTARATATAMKDLNMGWCCPVGFTPLIYTSVPGEIMAAPKLEYLDEWENWVRMQVVAMIAAGILPKKLKIEVWNEGNAPFYWLNPDPKIYLMLLRIVKRVCHSIDPDIVVSINGFAPQPDNPPKSLRPDTYVQKLYEAGMTGADFTTMGLHPYSGQRPIHEIAGLVYDMNTTILNNIAKTMAARGNPNKKFNHTEFGYSTKGPKKLTQAQQATYLREQLIYLRNLPTTDVAFIFNWKDLGPEDEQNNGMGLLGLDGKPKEAFYAVKEYLAAHPAA